MKKLCISLALLGFTLALGCGGDDPNKNLKPIDPKTPPPKLAAPEGAGQTGEKAPTVIK